MQNLSFSLTWLYYLRACRLECRKSDWILVWWCILCDIVDQTILLCLLIYQVTNRKQAYPLPSKASEVRFRSKTKSNYNSLSLWNLTQISISQLHAQYMHWTSNLTLLSSFKRFWSSNVRHTSPDLVLLGWFISMKLVLCSFCKCSSVWPVC